MPFLQSVENQNNKRKENNKKFQTKKSWIYKNIYNTSRWQKLRKAYLSENPLCEECIKNNKVTEGKHVHHITPISNGLTENEMIGLGFDWNNLQTLCEECHSKKHEKKIDYFLFDD